MVRYVCGTVLERTAVKIMLEQLVGAKTRNWTSRTGARHNLPYDDLAAFTESMDMNVYGVKND